MKSLLPALLLCATLLFAADATPSPQQAASPAQPPKHTVKIGVILPLSGNNAALGETCQRVLKLFKAELASGQYRHDYQLIVEDDQMTGRLTAVAANKLLNIDHVDALLTFSSGTGNVVAPLADQKKIPHLCIGSDVSICVNHPYSFLHWTHPTDEAFAFFKLLQTLGYQRVGVVCVRQAGALAVLGELKRLAPYAHVELTGVEMFNPGERDFRVQLTRLNETKPQAIIPLGFSPELEILLRRLRELGIDLPRPSIEVYDFLSVADAVALIEGQYYVSAAVADQEFSSKLKAASGKGASGYAVPQYYNCLHLLRAAFEGSATASPAEATRFLTALKDFPSPLGLLSADTDRFIRSPCSLFQIRKGRTIPATISSPAF